MHPIIIGLVTPVVAAVVLATPTFAAEPDWTQVAQALGKSGAVQTGGVYRVGFPRTDLQVSLDGVAHDEAAAMAWFRKAAEQDHANGQFSLASLYYGRKEYSPAASWYRRAAEQGNALAQIRLARMYAEGTGLARDDIQAFKWFAVAATRGADSYARANAIKGRDTTAMKMTPAQVGEAERLVREWKPKLER
jgi:TPR repeat protein